VSWSKKMNKWLGAERKIRHLLEIACRYDMIFAVTPHERVKNDRVYTSITVSRLLRVHTPYVQPLRANASGRLWTWLHGVGYDETWYKNRQWRLPRRAVGSSYCPPSEASPMQFALSRRTMHRLVQTMELGYFIVKLRNSLLLTCGRPTAWTSIG